MHKEVSLLLAQQKLHVIMQDAHVVTLPCLPSHFADVSDPMLT